MAVASSSFAVAMSDLPSPSQPSSSRASSPALTIAQPDHFYGSEGVQLPPSPRSEGKTWLDPDDDPLATRGIPVFKPSMEEFQDFEGYMKKIECWGRRSGIVKVIPPKAWKDALPSVTDKLANIKLHHPIEQHMIGRAGLFRQKNVETFRILSVREWAELCTKDTYRAPSVDDMGLGHHASTTGPYTRSGRARKKTKDPTPAAEQPGPSISLASPESTPILPIHRLDPEAPAEVMQEGEDLVMDRVTSTLESSQAKGKRKIGRTSKGARLAERAAKDASFMEDFDPDSDWLPPNTTPFDYTPDFCRQLERRFWRMCGMGTPAQYGADMAGSLFHDEKLPWNVAFLPSTLERIMPRAKHPTPGVNLPYLYFGMWRSTFAWHVEDCDLFSINYIHFGAGKFWYAIPQERANAFESVMRGYFPEGPNTCSQFLRHKAFLASPTILAQANCRPNTLVHNAGEFVITYPRGYHAGFNLGLNCAESTNFALESWLDLGRKAKYCTCVGDSVRIDVDALLQEREDEYTADNMTAPQATMLGDHDVLNQAVLLYPDPIAGYVDERTLYPLTPAPTPTTHNKPILPRKRKTSGFSDKPPRPSGPKSKKARTAASSSSLSSLVPTKLVLKLGPRPAEQAGFPCTLCVSTSREGLLPVHARPRYAHAAFASIVQGQWMAHELCARVVPETWIDEIGDVRPDGTRTRAVFGVDSIIRDRLNLRCAACTTMRAKMHGAPVQCTKGKCPKAFHVSCARENADILFREFEMESEVVADEPLVDGSPPDVVKIITKMDFDLLCAQHNPAILEARKASKEDKIRHDLHALPLGSRIKIRGHSGMFEVTLLRVHDEERTVDVIWDLGVERTFKWNSIISDENDIPAADIPSSSLANGSLVRWPAPASASSLAAAELAPSLSSSAAI